MANGYRLLAMYRARVQYPRGESRVSAKDVFASGRAIPSEVAAAMQVPPDLADRTYAQSIQHNPAFATKYWKLVARLEKIKSAYDPTDRIDDYCDGGKDYQKEVESAIADSLAPEIDASDLLREAEQLEARATHRIPRNDIADLAKLRESAAWITTAARAMHVDLPELPSPATLRDVQLIAGITYNRIRQHGTTTGSVTEPPDAPTDLPCADGQLSVAGVPLVITVGQVLKHEGTKIASLTDLEAKILAAINGREDIELADLSRNAWGRSLSRRGDTRYISRALSGLRQKIETLPIHLTVKNHVLLISRSESE